MWWLLLIGAGGLWVAENGFPAALGGKPSSGFSNADMEKAVSIAIAKETNPDRLTQFARVMQAYRPDLANELETQAHKLALPLTVALEVSSASKTATQPAAQKFTAHKLTGH